MPPRDTRRERFYEAERMVFRMFERAGGTHTVQLAGTELTLPVEVQFASVDSVRDYVGRVLSMPSVKQRFDAASTPVSVRARRGHRSAHYARRVDSDQREIAIPDSTEGRWALRELVVLHEIAHHLDDSDGPAHGREFATTLTELVGVVLGPEAEFVYRVVFADSGL
ncbi:MULTISPECIES: TIGR04338 family metallohydrolase [Gordonia]|uniref:TIGR04338 family metallohydrolase n=1 Tax=Gordonia TaxID=2053 RepID=UPI0007EA3B3C|nr:MULTISPECIES: TIGR04338 family metallohydrolase [Gordonia]MCM3897290.1 TIGR04338 family metallohydrolase [Gordonia sputi]OBA33703.1 hypothetical protein A5766_11375 [Gordonia sp. 852002-51296_SCH5728562-b]OBA65183.1 hypothetical protein A5777_21015 [Gordonia sp. 852002-10350_SCH5691597]